MPPRPVLHLGFVALAGACVALVGACSGGGGGASADPGPPLTEVTVVSTKTAFETEAFAVPAGQEVTVTYDNRHLNVQHNIHFGVEVDGEEPETELESGPDVQEVRFQVDEPGEYDYICDLHPNEMQGTMTVVEAGGGG